MVAVTYTAKPGDPTFTRWHGLAFEHGKPTEVPADHLILKKDDKSGKSPLDHNDWFSTSDKKVKPAASKDDIETPGAYFTYASAWIAKATTSGSLKTRYDSEQPMRERAGWGSDDQERMDEIFKPKFDALKREEATQR